MSLMDEIHRNQINVEQLIILFGSIKRVILPLYFVLQAEPQDHLMNMSVRISTRCFSSSFSTRLIEAGNSIISLLYFLTEKKTHSKSSS